MANRTTAGLLLVALIVDAALMIQVEQPLPFWLAIFYLTSAGAGALALAFRTLFADLALRAKLVARASPCRVRWEAIGLDRSALARGRWVRPLGLPSCLPSSPAHR